MTLHRRETADMTSTAAENLERRRAPRQREADLWRHAVGAHQRLSFLSEAGRALSETLEPEGVLDRLARLAVPRVAEWCVIDLLDEDGRMRLAGVADAEPRRAGLIRELRRRFPPDPERHISFRAAREGRPILCGGPDDRVMRSFTRSREQRRLQRLFQPGSFVCVPIPGRGGAIGAMSFGRRRGPALTAADVELARELSARAGAAIENARLYAKARETDALLSRALSANRMVAWSWDLETGRVQRSSNAAEIYGVDEREIGRGLHLIHPHDRQRYDAVLAKAIKSGVSFTHRFRMVRRDGSVSWMEEHASMTGSGRMSGVVMDITAQKLAEDQLRLQEEVSRIVSESAGVEDAFPRLLRAVGEAMGWSSGRGWQAREGALLPAGAWGAGAGTDTRGRGGGAAGSLPRAVLADGQASWVCSVPPRRGRRGAPRQSCAFAFPLLGSRGALGVLEFRGDGAAINDHSRAELFERLGRQIGAFLERKESEAALERKRREQQVILNSVPAMIWYKDGRNRVLRCNRAAALWYGRPEEAIEGKTAYELFPERGADYHKDDLAVMRSGRPKLGLVEECVSPAGARCWLRRDLIPLTDERGRAVGVIVFAVDITKIKKAEQALRESERVQRDFVANVSHEFRTPVAAIKGFAETLRRGGLRDRKNRLTFVRTIESHADRLDWLVQDLLNLSRLGSGMVKLKRQPLALKEFLEDYLRSVASIVERAGARVVVDAAEGLVALADRPHLVQVLDNLLSNALKYGKRGGTIRFEARARGRGARLSVRDEGAGIAAEHLPRLFDRFYRVAKGDGGGSTGLGLHIVKTIMRAQGGSVSVESVLGAGTAFHLSLQRAR
jgi:two-component system phosphate regulon sensor histidine kinase PhoR